jgi:UPF0755 protein
MPRLLILLLLLASAAAFALAWDLNQRLQAPLALGSPQTLEVRRGTALSQVVADMEARGWFGRRRDALYLRLYARASGDAARIKAGEYQATAQDSARDLLVRMVAGNIVLHELTLVEGWRFDQALAAVRAHPRIQPTPDGADGGAVMAALGLPGEHPEGRFLPETYLFPAGTTDVAFLRRAYHSMERTLDQAWAGRRDGLPYRTAYEALIMASIIERETRVADERRQVAGVFVRRLQRGMRLQTDPTVIYGLEIPLVDRLRRVHLTTDTPYNTYTRHGLPPTPIALPGRAAIEAALDPADGNALYFVSRKDGTHHFSATLEEHNAAVRRYQLGQK